MEHLKDGGYKSRKMVMSYVVMGLMTGGWLLTAKWPALGLTYAEYCMGLMGAAAIFVGGNTVSKWVLAKNAAPEKPVTPPKKAATLQAPVVEQPQD